VRPRGEERFRLVAHVAGDSYFACGASLASDTRAGTQVLHAQDAEDALALGS
jgi:hypothetical protein